MRFGLAAALAATAAGCGAVEPSQRVRASAEATAKRTPVKFEARATEPEDFAPMACSGALDAERKRVRFSCELEEGDSKVSFDTIAIGDVTYTRTRGFGFPPDADDRTWEKDDQSAEDDLMFLDPAKLLGLLRRATKSSERLGTEEVRGVSATRYRLVVDAKEADLGDTGAPTAEVDVWIDGDDLVRRISVGGEDSFTLEFFDFGEPVEIEPPPASDVRETPRGAADYGGDDEVDCDRVKTSPLTLEVVLRVLRRHGFDIDASSAYCTEVGGVTIAAADEPTGSALFGCFLQRSPASQQEALGVPDEPLLLKLENLTCLADKTRPADVARLRAAFAELERSLR